MIATMALSGLFELYTRSGHLNHEAKASGLKVHLECDNQINYYVHNTLYLPEPMV